MKKLPILLALLSFVTLSSFKAEAQHHLYLGARVGANLANQSYDSLPSGATISMHTGFLAGAQFDYWFDDMWALSAQALYDQKGAHEDLNITETFFGQTFTETGTSDLTFNYLEIPILLKASFGTGDFRPYVFAGPSFGLFLSGTQKVHITGSGSTVDTTQSIADSSVKSPDISAVLGAGISLNLSSGSMLFFDAAYALGLVNIAKTQPGDNTTVKSRDIRLAVGILFPLD